MKACVSKQGQILEGLGELARSGFHSEYIGYLGFLEIRSDIVLF